MFSFRKSTRNSTKGGTGGFCSADAEEVLCLDARQIVQGIRYHILDGNIARAVSNASCAQAEDRLVERHDRLTVSRRGWGQMTDAQRLRWLLEQSHTSFTVGRDGLAELIARA
jgi:hypothetical protein